MIYLLHGTLSYYNYRCSKPHQCQQCFYNMENFYSNIKGAGKLGELSRIIVDLSDILASGASPSAMKRLEFSESATIMHFDAHKKFQFHQITLSSSNDHFITFNDNYHFDDDRVI